MAPDGAVLEQPPALDRLAVAVTTAAGSLDSADDAGRADLAAHVRSVAELLILHAEHEDTVIQPVLEERLPSLAEQIAIDHPNLEARIVEHTARTTGHGDERQLAIVVRDDAGLANVDVRLIPVREDRVDLPGSSDR